MTPDTSRRPRHIAAEIFDLPSEQWQEALHRAPPEWRALIKQHLRTWLAKHPPASASKSG